jgi:hypothetical protein
MAANDIWVLYGALDTDLVDLSRQGLRARKAENVVDAIVFPPCHRFGTSVVPVAPGGDARLRPALAEIPDEPVQKCAHAARRLAWPQHGGDVAASFGVANLDRQKTALVIMLIPTKAPVCNGIMPPGDSGIMAPPCNGMIPPGRRVR